MGNNGEFIYSTIMGDSATAMAQILRLCVPEGAVVADLTFNKGRFWKQVERSRYRIIGSDLAPMPGVELLADLRHTPYRTGSLDCVVIDPPYGNASTKPRRDGMFDSYNCVTCMTPAEIRALYAAGIPEAWRILKPRGVLILKCQSFVDGGKQHWIHIEVFNQALAQGFTGQDEFRMIPSAPPIIRHPDRPQQHARKWGSTFWVFTKPRERRVKRGKRGQGEPGKGPF